MIYQGDALTILKTLPSESANMCVTSPPYYALRDYGVDGQIGLESTPEEYIKRLVDVFHEVKRVLKDDGTLWVNIGDTYCGTGDKGDYRDPKYVEGRNGQGVSRAKKIEGIKQKDLIGIPWMLAFALRADGWYLRQDIIWQKPNPMPESVTDRCTKSHEYIFLLSKKQGYYYDYAAIQEDAISKDDRRAGQGRIVYGGKREKGRPDLTFAQQSFVAISDKRNKRDVWSVPLKPYSGAHFATFPEKLIEPCILAGTSKGGWFSIVSTGAARQALCAPRTRGNTSA